MSDEPSRINTREPASWVDLRRRVSDFVRREIGEEEARLGVGVSGGGDSVALLRLLCDIANREGDRAEDRKGWDLYVIHIHHGVRGRAADLDKDSVEELREELGLPGCTVTLSREELGGEDRPSEQTLRRARYAAFERVAQREDLDYLLLGHSLDDQAETVLHRLLRGSGPAGLAGMAARSRRGDLTILRPLLDVRRSEIRRALEEEGHSWREDASNKDEGYTRNRLRERLLPSLEEEYNPRLVEHLAALAAQFADDRDFWRDRIERYLEGEEDFPAALRREPLQELSAAERRRVLHHWLGRAAREANVDPPVRRHIHDLDRFIAEADQGMELTTLGGMTVRLEGEVFHLIRSDRPEPPLDLPRAMRIEKPIELDVAARHHLVELHATQRPPSPVASETSLFLPLKMIQGEEPLVLRNRQPGDRLHRLLDPKRPKLKEAMHEAGIPAYHRDFLPLLVQNGDVIWVPNVLAPKLDALKAESDESTPETATSDARRWVRIDLKFPPRNKKD